MAKPSPIGDYINALKNAQAFEGQIVYHRDFAPSESSFATAKKAWPPAIRDLLRRMGIELLYAHQTQGIDSVRDGIHTVAATPTASGKTLIYTLPVIEAVADDPKTAALFVYPLKALAQDQLKNINALAELLPEIELQARIYDGDTSSYWRKKIRDNPPNILLTNPEMIHLSILPHHERWVDLLRRLRFVVIDEVHVYRGVLGTHMAQVFRRLVRICRFYDSFPTFIFTSATVANPAELAENLTGLPVETVSKSTAGKGRRHFVLIEPVDGPLAATLRLLKAALTRGLRTIVYTRSRKLTELLAIWAKQHAGALTDRISAYRAGFLPEERREIEAKLSSGELLAVIATSALELGIDIGALDLCLLVGYPGSIIATWQRGGRVGRSGRESAVILVAGEDALDTYFVNNPDQLVQRPPEAAVVNPFNPQIMARHLVCAAAELPLDSNDSMLRDEQVRRCIKKLVEDGEIYQSADGKTYYSPLKNPHRHLDLRGSGSRFAIINEADNLRLGEIDGVRVYRETHPGAIYLHQGKTYRVTNLDTGMRRVVVQACTVRYHTRVRSHKETRIIETFERKTVCGTAMAVGRLEVTETVTGYDCLDTRSGSVVQRVVLDLPPLVFETQGLWFVVPEAMTQAAQKAQVHVMGGLHAMEHAAIGVFPLLVLADRNDLGGISTPFHPQLEAAAIFVYDGIPGGAGLCLQAFEDGQALLQAAHDAISGCPCETGCPSCVHSPKCGSGNRPIDKAGALFFLERLLNAEQARETLEVRMPFVVQEEKKPVPGKALPDTPEAPSTYGVLDIETQRSAQEVGGWHRADRMGVSCAVLYDSGVDDYFEFVEGQVPMLVDHLQRLDLVVGFNIKRFDYLVLSAYTNVDLLALSTLDLLEEVKNRLGYRLSLDHLASVTLDAGKIADGLDALKWWKEGKMAKILEYCRSDVTITRDLYLFGRQNQFLLFRNKARQKVRVPVDWT